tara:strand:- start:3 stop:242 length:240 start_codon:yes stop_codon:yes gene_type:complete
MKLVKTSAGEYEGIQIKDGYTVTCEASAQSYNGFSYTIRVNGHITSDDGYTGLRLYSIKQMVCSDWMIEDAIELHKNGY